MNNALKDSYIGKVADALQPYSEFRRVTNFFGIVKLAELA